MDEAESLLFARMSKVIPAPPNPAPSTFQMLYNDDKEIAQQILSDPTANGTTDQKSQKRGLWHKEPWTKLRSLLSRVRMLKQTDNIVKVYMKLKNSPGGWAELVQKMYADMIMAKNSGVGDSAQLRETCREALQLIGKEHQHGAIDLQKIEPFKDFWTLVKSSANSLLALFSGPFRNESVGQRRKELGNTRPITHDS
uniref:Gag_p30 domain-containing protein n=1 Tax=Globodera pallida TaxID=36090 RepID=A0A183BRM3_GLOPA